MHRRHLEHYARDPLARELRPALPAEAARRPPLIFPERDASDVSSGGLRQREPLFQVAQRIAPATDEPASLPIANAGTKPVPRLYAQDSRVFHPRGKDRPALKLNGVPADVTVARTDESSASGVAFHEKGLVIPCIRRKVRREVMFARRKAGRGYKVPHRRNWMSEVAC